MLAAAPASGILRFDGFELDTRAGELRKAGVKLRLQGQPIQVLAALLNSAGELLTREQLRAEVWPAETFVDFDHSLHNSIARIREVLGDSAGTPRYIETLPRRGYRFIGTVEKAGLENTPLSAPAGSSVEAPAAPPQTKARAILMVALSIIVAIAAASDTDNFLFASRICHAFCALHRSAASRQLLRRSRPGIFRRRHDR